MKWNAGAATYGLRSVLVEFSVRANLQKFVFGRVRPFPNIVNKFGRSSSRFGNFPACAVDGMLQYENVLGTPVRSKDILL